MFRCLTILSFLMMANLAFAGKVILSPEKLNELVVANKVSDIEIFSSKRFKLYDSNGSLVQHIKKSSKGKILKKDGDYAFVTFDSECKEVKCALKFKSHGGKLLLQEVNKDKFSKIEIQKLILYRKASPWRACRYCEDSKFYSVSPFFKKMSKTWIALKASNGQI